MSKTVQGWLLAVTVVLQSGHQVKKLTRERPRKKGRWCLVVMTALSRGYERTPWGTQVWRSEYQWIAAMIADWQGCDERPTNVKVWSWLVVNVVHQKVYVEMMPVTV